MKQISAISVFFPAFNEGANLESTVQKAIAVLTKVADKYEIVIVNDGSTDDTGEVAAKLAHKHKTIRVITHAANRGYGAAFKSGLYAGRYPWIAFTDADGQFDFAEITKFINEQKRSGADMVIGYYLDRKVSISRKLNSFLWQLVIFMLFGLKVRDIDCGFKLISKRVADKVSDLESERGAFITSEFLIKSRKAGFKITEVGVNHYPRIHGKATGANWKVIVKSFIDLARLWRKLH